MSGGGAKGSFEAGVLHGLYMNDPVKSNYAYDVITGVSAGALNTLAFSIFAPGDEGAMLQFLTDTWEGLEDSDVYENWSPLGLVTGVLAKSGVYNDAPLTSFLTRIFAQFGNEIRRKMVVSCVNVLDGAYHTFTEKTLGSPADIVKAVVSSASIPGVFPHQVWNDTLVCMDGGTVYNTNLVSAVERCREQVDDDSEIILDAIICDDYHIEEWHDQNDVINNWMRFQDLKNGYDSMADIYEFKQAYPNITYRYYVQPSTALPGGLSLLNFDNKTNTFPMQMQGRLDGENAIKDGPGHMWKQMDNYRSNATLQKTTRISHWMLEQTKVSADKWRRARRQQFDEPKEESPKLDFIQ